jgi:hypothetical protein
LEWFEHIDTVLFCEFIERWPTLKQAKRARKNTLRTFFSAHNMRFAHVVERRVRAIKEALPLTSDEAVIIPHRLQALIFVEQLRVTLKAIKRYDEEIEKLADNHVDYGLFSPLPGAGPSLAPRRWWPLARTESVTKMQQIFKSTRRLLLLPNAVAINTGYIGDGSVLRFFDKRLSNGLGKR